MANKKALATACPPWACAIRPRPDKDERAQAFYECKRLAQGSG